MPIISSPWALYQHSTTKKKIIKAALRKIGALGAGEEPDAGMFQDALDELNRLLDSWNTERLTVNVINKNEWTISASVSFLTIGPNAQLDQIRPAQLEAGSVFLKDGDIEYEVCPYNQEQWAAIHDKTLTGRPTVFYYEQSFPLGRINFFPITDKQYNLILYTWNLLSQVSNIEQALALLPGYTKAIVLGLAIDLAPEYGKQAPGEVLAGFIEAKSNLKRINKVTPELRVDDALLSDNGFYDITRGY